jgi:hypothetical protein
MATQQVQQTTTATTSPWAGAIPALNSNLSEAQRLYTLGPSKYTPWSQVADMNGNQMAALKGVGQYVNSAGVQGLLGSSSNLVSGLLSGKGYNPQQQLGQMGAGNLAGYMQNNNQADPTSGINRFMYQNTSDPSLQSNVQGAMNRVQGNMGGATSVQGIGNKIAQDAYNLNNTNTMNNMFSNAYDTQNQNRLTAIGMGNNYRNNQAQTAAELMTQGANNNLQNSQIGQQYFGQILQNPIDMLNAQNQAGMQMQQYNQNQLNDASNRWNFDQNAKWDNLTRYNNIISPIANMGSTRTGAEIGTQQGTNRAAGIAGGALSGAGLGATFGPWGALAGGVIGGALGAFSK